MDSDPAPLRAAEAFVSQAAASVTRSDGVFGVLYRRMKARIGSAQAAVTTAHLMVWMFYCLVKDKLEYQPLRVEAYEPRYHQQQVRCLQKKAARLGFQRTPA